MDTYIIFKSLLHVCGTFLTQPFPPTSETLCIFIYQSFIIHRVVTSELPWLFVVVKITLVTLTLWRRILFTVIDNATVFYKWHHRYRVQCSPGQIISYSVLDFDLEGSSTCSSGTECLDYVEINYQNLATRQRFCGGGETGEVQIEGSNELTFEFVSNRQTEKRGFKFFVNCIDPSTDVNGLRVGAVVPAFEPSSNRIGNFRIGNFDINPCSEPPNMAPRPLIFEVCWIFAKTMGWSMISCLFYFRHHLHLYHQRWSEDT